MPRRSERFKKLDEQLLEAMRADPELNLLELGRQYGTGASAIRIDSAEGERAASPVFGADNAASKSDELFIRAVEQTNGASSDQ